MTKKFVSGFVAGSLAALSAVAAAVFLSLTEQNYFY